MFAHFRNILFVTIRINIYDMKAISLSINIKHLHDFKFLFISNNNIISNVNWTLL